MSKMNVPTWEEAYAKAKKNVGQRYTMVPVENSPSEEELEEYARNHIKSIEDLIASDARVNMGQLFLNRHLLETLSEDEYELVFDYLADVMGDSLVESLKKGTPIY